MIGETLAASSFVGLAVATSNLKGPDDRVVVLNIEASGSLSALVISKQVACHMDIRFDKKNVIITGGTRGIGKQIVTDFYRLGANVYFLYSSSDEAARYLEEELIQSSQVIKGFKCDISDYKETQTVITCIIKECKVIDVLVNNAGLTKDSYFGLMSKQSWDKVIDVNLNGTFNVTKACSINFMKHKSGVVLNMTSIAGLLGTAGQTNYSASKAGIIGFTKSLSKELAAYNVRVNAIAPGYIATDMTDKLAPNLREEFTSQVAMKRFGTTQEVSNLVLFLASNYSSYITGEVISVSGGL